ncbi:hypothetical protein LTR36_010535 [Oleoguttula mirabilis]|uniref:Nucleotide-diphospho-sugar transferase n=1 Tax=Oleoguttula mirabilis TaxID=1507867 RepID=A0AAV9J4K1_9PEZI|nr:hypothetical protein LTR36_010535 [Oleoguttula mirabilis]
MQSPLINLATAGILLCTTFFVWSSVQYLGDHDWTYPEWRATMEDPEAEGTLLMENQRLEQALEAPRASALYAPAVSVTAISPEATGTSDVAPAEALSQHAPAISTEGFAYLFYATADPYACSALVNIHRLQHVLNATVPIHVLASSDVREAYIAAFRAANATVHIEQAPPLKDGAGGYYQDCLLKLLAFKMHVIDPSLRRVLAFDSDQLIMQNLDHLFSGLPDVDLAAPRAYWLAKDFLASTFLMINLSDRLWHAVEAALATVDFDVFDMDLINNLLGDTVMMLSGEYVTLNSHWEDWNLPRWHHPVNGLNMTTVEIVNELAKSAEQGVTMISKKRQDDVSLAEVDFVDLPSPNDEEAGLSNDAQPVPAKKVHTMTMIPPLQSMTPEPKGAPQRKGPTKPPEQPVTSPRFPANHPLTLELYRLQNAASVIHFTAQGKPWMKSADTIRTWRPHAHPVLAEQFELWRDTASEVCPDGR